jgi:hypothetical protein
MNRVPGSASAEVLLRVGLAHDDVVRALIREIGLDQPEAECAWTAALQTIDDAYPHRAAAVYETASVR